MQSGTKICILRVTSGTRSGARLWLRMGESVEIGRQASADFVIIDDAHISRHHFTIEGEQGEFRVRDLGSSNGTYLNGKRVKDSPLTHGDVVQAGTSKFEVCIEADAAGEEHARPDNPPVATRQDVTCPLPEDLEETSRFVPHRMFVPVKTAEPVNEAPPLTGAFAVEPPLEKQGTAEPTAKGSGPESEEAEVPFQAVAIALNESGQPIETGAVARVDPPQNQVEHHSPATALPAAAAPAPDVVPTRQSMAWVDQLGLRMVLEGGEITGFESSGKWSHLANMLGMLEQHFKIHVVVNRSQIEPGVQSLLDYSQSRGDAVALSETIYLLRENEAVTPRRMFDRCKGTDAAILVGHRPQDAVALTSLHTMTELLSYPSMLYTVMAKAKKAEGKEFFRDVAFYLFEKNRRGDWCLFVEPGFRLFGTVFS